MRFSVAALAIILGAVSGVRAETLCVAPDASGDAATVQEAIDAAADGDVIELEDGTYTGPGNRDISFEGKALVIRSRSGDAGSCIIDCRDAASDPHRAFVFENGERESSILESVTIRYGVAPAGGAFTVGGGILCGPDTRPTIRRCRILSCRAEMGGGLMSQGAGPAILDCEFEQNFALQGGALYALGTGWTVTLKGCSFVRNTGFSSGGAFHITLGGAATFDECTFFQNESSGRGGAGVIYCAAQGRIEGCTFHENQAGLGGALEMHDSRTVVEILKSTFYGNGAFSDAAITRWDGCALTLENTIIASSVDSRALSVGDCEQVSIACCNFFGSDGGDWSDCLGNLVGVDGNFSADPGFCDPEHGNFRLNADSPCFQAGGCGLIGAFPVGCETSAAPEPVAAVGGLRLEPITPNPATPPVRVAFSIPDDPERSLLALRVFDSSGRLVRSLDETVGRSGVHEIWWDGTSQFGAPAPDGVYFLKLSIGRLAGMGRVVLVR